MTATERLRALLTERGVEWEDMSMRPYACTSWHDPDGEPCTALEGADDIPDGKLSVQALLTPEQAVEATLGREDSYTRENVESAFVSGYSLGSLPVGSDPQWDENRQTVDEHMAEWGWARIVRCMDCKHYREHVNGCVEFGDESRGEYANVEPDGFCAWASRKESE